LTKGLILFSYLVYGSKYDAQTTLQRKGMYMHMHALTHNNSLIFVKLTNIK